MKLPLRPVNWKEASRAIRSSWKHFAKRAQNAPFGSIALKVAGATTAWLLIYILPAIVTGLIFAAALGRYTTETQFAQNAFQSYLRPYQTQYRSCLAQMDALRERWENLELMLKFTAENKDASAVAPIVVFTHEGSISVQEDDDAEKVLGKIVISSRRASDCIDEAIRQADELATLLGRKEWFASDVSNREKRMAEYQAYIQKAWAMVEHLQTWEIVEGAVQRARDSEPASSKMRSDAQKYQASVARFRAHLFDAHVRHKDWFAKLDANFRDELAARSSRSVGFYLGTTLQEVLPFGNQAPRSALAIPEPSLAWTTAIDQNPPSADCNCGRPFAGGAYQRLGDPP